MVSVLVALCLAAAPGEESNSERQARLIRHELEELKLAIERDDLRAQLLTPEENVRLSRLDGDLRRYSPRPSLIVALVGGSVFVVTAVTSLVFMIYELIQSAFCSACGSALGFGWLGMALLGAGSLIALIVGLAENAKFRTLSAPLRNERELLLMQIAARHLEDPRVSPPPLPAM